MVVDDGNQLGILQIGTTNEGHRFQVDISTDRIEFVDRGLLHAVELDSLECPIVVDVITVDFIINLPENEIKSHFQTDLFYHTSTRLSRVIRYVKIRLR